MLTPEMLEFVPINITPELLQQFEVYVTIFQASIGQAMFELDEVENGWGIPERVENLKYAERAFDRVLEAHYNIRECIPMDDSDPGAYYHEKVGKELDYVTKVIRTGVDRRPYPGPGEPRVIGPVQNAITLLETTKEANRGLIRVSDYHDKFKWAFKAVRECSGQPIP